MSRYFLDANAVSDVIRDPLVKVGQRLMLLTADDVSVSLIVAAELRFGAERRRSAALATRIDGVLASWTVEPLKPPVDRVYA